MSVRIAHVATVDLTHRFLLLPQLRRLRDEGYDVTAISAPGPWVGDLEAEGIRFVPWRDATRAWDPQADVRAFLGLVRIFRRERFDLVHTHNPKPGVLGRIAARAVGVPCVVNTVHGLYATPEDRLPKKVFVLGAEWLAARASDLELYQSEEDLRWARRLGIARRGRRAHLGNGVDLQAFSPRPGADAAARKLRADLGIAEDEVVVGTVGRMVREKGYLELFEAARLLGVRVPHARFLVVGETDPSKPDAVGGRDIADAPSNVLFAGWREDVRDVLAAMDVFVLPSWREGVPRSAIEAAATGLPLVVTDIRGCREVVRDGVEGLLVPPRDPAPLAGAIERLVGDQALRARMGAAARARAEERFDERRVADLIVERYRTLLAASTIAPPAQGTDGIRLRRARPRDARALAQIHAATLPRAFLPTLGEPFLAQLYRSIATDPGSVAFLAQRDREILGFAAGTVSVPALYRRFAARRGAVAAALAAPRLIRSSVLERVREIASYPDRAEDLPRAELLSIALVPEARARGVGRALTVAVLGALDGLGVDEAKVVVEADNLEANRFYERVGFRHARRIEVHGGVESNVWVVPCRSFSRSRSPSLSPSR